ncbi:MAG TPA: tRNA (adenosine(37)-N6)-dimethylallyltransferase MiaA [Burkholderiales bacterium]|nr:tRNA (adenosine(37)-N6)-dimethylallyltransferase MiaA [Burkholderiales bacterium]
MGPTASGKTAVAVELVQKFPCEIISVDSALIYRFMNIGAAKPDAEVLARAPHRLIDIRNPDESYSAAQFREDALREMAEISARGKVPLLVGGTMLYFKALREGLSDLPEADADIRRDIDEKASRLGWPALHAELAALDPVTAARLKPMDSQRIQRALEVCLITGKPMSAQQGGGKADLPYRVIAISLEPSDRAALHARIAQRFDVMVSQGLLDEVRRLRRDFSLTPNMPSMRCVGYRQAWEHLDGEIDFHTFREKGLAATRQLAKRQLTWLRGMDDVERFDCLAADLTSQILNYALSSLRL